MKIIPLTRGLCAIVDDEHYDYLNQWKWYCSRRGKAVRFAHWRLNGQPMKRCIYMHREIAGITGYEVDHRNHDTLDNRSENLRIATRSENTMNRRGGKLSKALPKGVAKRGEKFRSYITKNGKRTYLGTFPTEAEAALAYNKKAIDMFGEFALPNTVWATSNAD